MNYLQKSIAIAAPGILLSAPACANRGGMFSIFFGLPLLSIVFLFYLSGSLSAAPAGKRFRAFIQSIFIGALWFSVLIGPWFQSEVELFLRSYEAIWAIAIPILLFMGSRILRKRFRKT